MCLITLCDSRKKQKMVLWAFKQELQRALLKCRFQSSVPRNMKIVSFGDFTIMSLQKTYSVEHQKSMQMKKTQVLPSGAISELKSS